MPNYKYGYEKYDKEKMAGAQLYNIDASYKQLMAVCAAIRGKSTDAATEYLEKAVKGEIPVRFKKHAKRMAHRKELGGKRGKYPMKASKYVLQVVKNAAANATAKGILNPIIVYAAANKQSTYPRLQSKGRRTRADYVTSIVQIVVAPGEEIEEVKEKKKVKKAERKKEEKKEK